MVVVTRQTGDMHQAIDIEIVQLNEYTEVRNRRNDTLKLLTNLARHVLTFEPGGDITCGLIGTAFGHRTVFTELQHLLHTVINGERRVSFKLIRTIDH